MPTWVDWIGYIASVLVLVSLLMTSIVRLRIINLVGSAIFASYGFLIQSIPTGFMNSVIVLVNILFLIRFYRSKEYFTILNTTAQEPYLTHFLDFYRTDILKFNPRFADVSECCTLRFYVLRNMTPAGLFLGQRIDDHTLLILLDYATPAYRDLKIGRFIYMENEAMFQSLGYHRLQTFADQADQIRYLLKMGFEKDPADNRLYMKTLA